MTIKKIKEFINNCNDFEVKIIGKSVLGQNICAINKIYDNNFKWAILTAGIHAREHLSCDFLCEQIEKLKSLSPLNYNLSIIPLVNPDGMQIATEGIANIPKKFAKKLLQINGSDDFSLYKANANGVDLNNNWPANWEKCFSLKTKPSSQGFYGYSPLSEPETLALAKWTEKINPFLTINFHLKGEEIYFDFFQDERRFQRDEKIAKIFAESTGYKIKKTQDISSGGYKDWCVQTLKIPALTIELGNDKFSHPFPQNELSSICKKNEKLFENIEKSLKIYLNYQKK